MSFEKIIDFFKNTFFYNKKTGKIRFLLVISLVILFFLSVTLLSSYRHYKTAGPRTEQVTSAYDEESFKRLHDELIKDKPETKESKELLEEIVEENNRKGQVVSTTANRDEIYSKEHFDTLAVNCSVLLEKYKELVVAYHELKSQ